MSTLYQITDEYMQLLQMAEDPDIDEEILKDTMEGIEGELEDKAQNYAIIIQELQSEAYKVKAEIDRLQLRKKSLENNIQRMKDSLEKAMRATDKLKFKTELYSFSIRKNPPSVVLADNFDINEVDAEYIKFADPELDKTKVKEALKAGTELGWARLESKESLSIK